MGPASAGVTVIPQASATVPGAPTIVRASGENGAVTLDFIAPASTGGSAIVGYLATCSPGSFSATGSASPLTVRNLVNGTTYSCTVAATNAAGTGPQSTPVLVIPK